MTSLLSQNELAEWKNGTFHLAYEKLGAHIEEDGVEFAVWAPNAYSVSVVGAFNDWDGTRHPMKKDEHTGIWSVHVPGAGHWALYKYELKTGPEAPPFLKSDPYAFYSELRPKMASIVYELDGYEWSDSEWMEQRHHKQTYDQPISVYEVHLGSWKRKGYDGSEFLTYRELADELVPYVRQMGFTHIELMPVAEHPFDPSWGYQITGYYAPTSRFGEPKEFMYFVDRCHREGIGVIMDWVPGHFPKDEQALQMFDGTPLYEHDDPRRREQKDWGTYVFDYSKPEVCNFLISNAAYWCQQYHIDGLRVDAVASMLYLDYSKEKGEWTPNFYGGNEHLEAINFLREFNNTLNEYQPGVVTIAEESTSWPGVTQATEQGGLGFDFKWNMGWMNDTLSYMEMGVKQRERNPRKVTFPMVYATDEKFVLPLSHDEVVHLKKPLVKKSPVKDVEQFANLRLLYTYMLGHPGKKLLFMGGEFAQTSEWTEDKSLEWSLLQYDRHKGIQKLVNDLMTLYKNEPALFEREYDGESFEWIDLSDRRPGLFSFLRKANEPSNHLFFILNFTNHKIDDYAPGPFEGVEYELVINTESIYYGGTNTGGHGGKKKEQRIWLAPFSGLILKSVFNQSGA